MKMEPSIPPTLSITKSKTDKWEEVKAESETTDNLVTLDGYTKFTPGCGQVPSDQYGKAFDPTQTSSANPSVANIPCRGTYYKFEPAKMVHSMFMLDRLPITLSSS